MENLTFEKMPEAVARIDARLDSIERLLSSLPTQKAANDLMNISQAAVFIDLAIPTIYGLVSRNEIPVNKRGKRLYFTRSELETWIKSGRKKTKEEIRNEASIKIKRP